MFLPQFRENFLGLGGLIRLKRDQLWTTVWDKSFSHAEVDFWKYTNEKYRQWNSMSRKEYRKCTHEKFITEQYSTGGGFMADIWERNVCEHCGKPLARWEQVY